MSSSCCGFCGGEIKEGDKKEVGKFWVVEEGRFVDICLGCKERVKNL